MVAGWLYGVCLSPNRSVDARVSMVDATVSSENQVHDGVYIIGRT